MRFASTVKIGCAAALFALATTAMPALAQAPVNTKAAETAQENAKSYRLVWTITEMDAGKQVGTQHFAMVVVVGGRSTMKMGSKVPIATGSYSTSGGAQTQFQYLDVGLNIDASLDPAANGLRLRSKVEQSSVADEKLTGNVREPVIRQAVLEGTSVVSLNKPLRIGSLDVPGSTRHLDVEVELQDVR